MDKKIEKDKSRFEQIIKGKIKGELKKYITKGEMIGRQGKNFVSIPIPQIEIPNFRYDHKQTGGVGQGEGDTGTPLGSDEPSAGSQAGDSPGEHIFEVDVSLEELAKMLGEELELPNIEPRGKKNITSTKVKYTGISPSGPESLKHFKRTYKQALRRQLISGEYDWKNPRIVPVHEDKRYRTWQETKLPECNAVIIYMMDVSGSMGDTQKEIVRLESFWIDTWLKSQYDGLDVRYVIHDAEAREVDEHTFYHTRENGGTRISSAYQLCMKIIESDYSPSDWNIYPFHFSDGDNWGGGDTEECIKLLSEALLAKVNLFCYGQVDSYYGSGQFLRDLEKSFKGNTEKLVFSRIKEKEGIYNSIKEFLGRGK